MCLRTTDTGSFLPIPLIRNPALEAEIIFGNGRSVSVSGIVDQRYGCRYFHTNLFN